MPNLILALGDITDMSTTVIVNAVNTGLLGGLGVDGAIHKAAGPGLYNFNYEQLRFCPPGELRISPALGNLQHNGVQWIFNTVGPRWAGDDSRTYCASILKRCYARCLSAAHQLGAPSIALPSISTGVYGYPTDEAAAIAFYEIELAREREYEGQIILVAFDHETLELFKTEARYSHVAYTEAATPFIGKLTR